MKSRSNHTHTQKKKNVTFICLKEEFTQNFIKGFYNLNQKQIILNLQGFFNNWYILHFLLEILL